MFNNMTKGVNLLDMFQLGLIVLFGGGCNCHYIYVVVVMCRTTYKHWGRPYPE